MSGAELRAYPDALEEWLRTPRGEAAETWQVDIMAKQTFPGRPTRFTFDVMHDALLTCRPRATTAQEAAS